jgi:acylphosphatase
MIFRGTLPWPTPAFGAGARQNSVMSVTRHLSICGRVQGVGFRYALLGEASARGLAGWVRNRRDGSVEALVQGNEAAVNALIAWARRGPPERGWTD